MENEISLAHRYARSTVVHSQDRAMRLRHDADVHPTALASKFARVVHKDTNKSIDGVGRRTDERGVVVASGVVDGDPVRERETFKTLTGRGGDRRDVRSFIRLRCFSSF